MDVPPNQTLYISNIYGKLRKDEAKQWLYALFGQYGKIIDVVCMSSTELKGQAWVVFADIAAAANALRAMQEFPFGDGRKLRVHYAQGKSNAVAKLDGSWGQEKQSVAAGKTEKVSDAAPSALQVEHVEVGEPNETLFVENLPEATTDAMLAVLFKQFPGYKNARTVPGRPGVAFVDFETDMQANVALSGLQGFKVTPTNVMKITYAKQ